VGTRLDPRELSGLAGTFLGDLDHDTLVTVLDGATLVDVPRGKPIFDEEGGGNRLGFLLEGMARNFVMGPESRQLTVQYARAGSILATNTLGSAGPQIPLHIQALNDCTVIELDLSTVQELHASDRRFSAAYAVELARRLEDVYRTFATTVQGTIMQRLSAHLLACAQLSGGGRISASTTQQDLAEALGSAREVIGRALKDLQASGVLVNRRGGIEILEAAELIALAGPWWTPSRIFAVNAGLSTSDWLEQAPQAVVAIDPTGAIVYANPSVERTFGWQPEALINRPITSVLPVGVIDDFSAMMSAFMDTVRPGRVGFGRVYHGRRADGSHFPAEISIVPIPGPHGTTIFATVSDVGYRDVLRRFLSDRPAVKLAPAPI
jgi:CRP/FNR family transcriptional regulator